MYGRLGRIIALSLWAVFLRAYLNPSVPVVCFCKDLDWIEYIRLYIATDGGEGGNHADEIIYLAESVHIECAYTFNCTLAERADT